MSEYLFGDKRLNEIIDLIHDNENKELNINGLQLQSLIFELATNPYAERIFHELLEEQKKAKLALDVVNEPTKCWVQYTIFFEAEKKLLENAIENGQIYFLSQELALQSLKGQEPCVQVKLEDQVWDF